MWLLYKLGNNIIFLNYDFFIFSKSTILVQKWNENEILHELVDDTTQKIEKSWANCV